MSARRKPSDPLLQAGDIRSATDSLRATRSPRRDYQGLDQDGSVRVWRPSNEAEAAEEAEDKQWAARGVARASMLTAHRCTGASCRSRRHGTDRIAMYLTLMALGLKEDPDSATVTDLLGRRVRPKPSGDAA